MWTYVHFEYFFKEIEWSVDNILGEAAINANIGKAKKNCLKKSQIYNFNYIGGFKLHDKEWNTYLQYVTSLW